MLKLKWLCQQIIVLMFLLFTIFQNFFQDLPPIYRPIVKKKLRRDEIIHSLHKKEVFFKDAEKT